MSQDTETENCYLTIWLNLTLFQLYFSFIITAGSYQPSLLSQPEVLRKWLAISPFIVSFLAGQNENNTLRKGLNP